MANNVILAGVTGIVILSIIIDGIICGLRLKRLLRHTDDRKSSFVLKSLIIKNTMLTTVASISTFINWTMWIVGVGNFGVSMLYLDYWFNCFIIGLAFNYNEKYYKFLFKSCILGCFLKCDKSFDKNDENQHRKQFILTKRYLYGQVTDDSVRNEPKTEHIERSKMEREMKEMEDVDIVYDLSVVPSEIHFPQKITTPRTKTNTVATIRMHTMDIQETCTPTTAGSSTSTCATASGLPQMMKEVTPLDKDSFKIIYN